MELIITGTLLISTLFIITCCGHFIKDKYYRDNYYVYEYARLN